MDQLSRTTYFGAAGASGGVGSFVTEFVSDDTNEQIESRTNASKGTNLVRLSDGSYIASCVIGIAGSQAPMFIKYNKQGEVVEVKKFDNGENTNNNMAVIGNFVYDEATDIIYFTRSRLYNSSISYCYHDILAYNWNTDAKVWTLYTTVLYYDVSCAIGIYDDGDYLLVEACKSPTNASGYRMVAKVRKSDGTYINSWRDNMGVTDSGAGLAGPYAEDSTKRYTLYYANGNGNNTTSHVFSMAKGTTTFPAPSSEFRIINVFADAQSRTRSALSINGDDVYIAFEQATNTFEVAKVNKSTGTTAWTKQVAYASNISPNGAAPYGYNFDTVVDSNGDLFTVGMTVRISTNFQNESNVTVHKFDGSNGDLLWARSIGRASTAAQRFVTTNNSIPIIDSDDNLIFGMTTKTYSDLPTSTTTDYGVHYLIKMKGDGSEVGDFGPISIMNMDSYSTVTNNNVAYGTPDANRTLGNSDSNWSNQAYTITPTDETNNANFFNNTTEFS